MFKSVEDFQSFGKDQFEAASAASSAMSKGFQQIAAEVTDYSKKSLEAATAAFEKVISAKSVDAAFQAQSEYAKSAYESFVAQSTKMGELYTALAKDAFKPVETAVAKVQAAAK
ncbi:phasin family protein [Methylocella sp. CPCC 101449]|jgi:phasin family protein|uniref:phasin family protein n=1 Tax=Methylocella sp. CPCC 101449 TaxID=2987531 RepID=UPI0028911F1F|nr:phasin family protein [Methylocella sp. CPCC 101449]MDT2022679.1 phasin family protein [Methylocella sp. CPCC 101449]HEV2572595.1 phasin family protein [Beijerinckiaceae bacterium]